MKIKGVSKPPKAIRASDDGPERRAGAAGMARPESWYKRRTAAGVRLPAPHYFKLKINNQKLRAMIKVTVKINTDEKKVRNQFDNRMPFVRHPIVQESLLLPGRRVAG